MRFAPSLPTKSRRKDKKLAHDVEGNSVTQVSLVQVSLVQVSLVQVSLVQVSLVQVSLVQVSLAVSFFPPSVCLYRYLSLFKIKFLSSILLLRSESPLSQPLFSFSS